MIKRTNTARIKPSSTKRSPSSEKEKNQQKHCNQDNYGADDIFHLKISFIKKNRLNGLILTYPDKNKWPLEIDTGGHHLLIKELPE